MDRPLGVVSAANTASPALYYVHVDHLNRPIMMTDGTKSSVWAATWLPWGSPYTIPGTATLDARFPGQWFQLETGLHYNWHRHYDPTIGRYTQPDPLGFVDGPSVYGYARNSAIFYIDKNGRFIPVLIGIAAGLALDYLISELKEQCNCSSADSSAGPLGYSALGAVNGLFGPYLSKPRGGALGSGRVTSVLSNALFNLNPGASGGALRNLGRALGHKLIKEIHKRCEQ